MGQKLCKNTFYVLAVMDLFTVPGMCDFRIFKNPGKHLTRSSQTAIARITPTPQGNISQPATKPILTLT
jgi:hypothetical protein